MRTHVRTALLLVALPVSLVAQGKSGPTPAMSDHTIVAAINNALPSDTGRQAQDTAKLRFEIYGFAMADLGFDFNQTNPEWFDVNRPSRLPSFANQYGQDGRFYAGVRQSRFGVKAFVPTPLGELRTTFEFDMFGVGVDAGQTTIRPRHFWGELGQFGAGQTNSAFMDGDVFPNIVEYWGPNGMLFFRNVQVRWMPLQGERSLILALERPGASGDGGVYADRIELQNVAARFPLPDISGAYKMGGAWGYVRFSGIVRYMKLDDLLRDAIDLNQTIWGGGGSISSNINFNSKKNVLRLQGIYGVGIENYFNDAPFDVGVENNFSNPVQPIRGKALPIFGLSAFLDHTWNDRFTSSIGYSRVDIDNSTGQAADAFHVGQYGAANVIYSPVKNVLMASEFQWGRRENNSDGFSVDDFRLQFSFKYSFSFEVGGKS